MFHALRRHCLFGWNLYFPCGTPPPYPPGKQIRAEEEVSFGNTNRFVTHRGQGSMRILPVVNTYSSAERVITHTLIRVPTCPPCKVASCQSIDSGISFISFSFSKSVRLWPCQEFSYLMEISPECWSTGKDKHNSAKTERVTCLLTHPLECPHTSCSALFCQRCEGPTLQPNTCGIITVEPETGLA